MPDPYPPQQHLGPGLGALPAACVAVVHHRARTAAPFAGRSAAYPIIIVTEFRRPGGSPGAGRLEAPGGASVRLRTAPERSVRVQIVQVMMIRRGDQK